MFNNIDKHKVAIGIAVNMLIENPDSICVYNDFSGNLSIRLVKHMSSVYEKEILNRIKLHNHNRNFLSFRECLDNILSEFKDKGKLILIMDTPDFHVTHEYLIRYKIIDELQKKNITIISINMIIGKSIIVI